MTNFKAKNILHLVDLIYELLPYDNKIIFIDKCDYYEMIDWLCRNLYANNTDCKNKFLIEETIDEAKSTLKIEAVCEIKNSVVNLTILEYKDNYILESLADEEYDSTEYSFEIAKKRFQVE